MFPISSSSSLNQRLKFNYWCKDFNHSIIESYLQKHLHSLSLSHRLIPGKRTDSTTATFSSIRTKTTRSRCPWTAVLSRRVSKTPLAATSSRTKPSDHATTCTSIATPSPATSPRTLRRQLWRWTRIRWRGRPARSAVWRRWRRRRARAVRTRCAVPSRWRRRNLHRRRPTRAWSSPSAVSIWIRAAAPGMRIRVAWPRPRWRRSHETTLMRWRRAMAAAVVLQSRCRNRANRRYRSLRVGRIWSKAYRRRRCRIRKKLACRLTFRCFGGKLNQNERFSS